jgi:hypothetical protein
MSKYLQKLGWQNDEIGVASGKNICELFVFIDTHADQG